MRHNTNQRKLQIWAQAIPLIKPFTIARGTRTQAKFLRARLNDYQTNIAVVSDCVPYSHYGESIESVMAQIAAVAPAIENGEMTRDNCHAYLPKGAARNGVNCLLWYEDLQLGHVSLPIMPSVTTAQTIVIDTPKAMGRAAYNHRHAPLLKIKLAGNDDAERLNAVRANAPTSTIIVDANESLTRASYQHYLPCFVENNIAMIEQPFQAGQDELLTQIPRPIPIYADESIHDRDDYKRCGHFYDGINIKLDKAGGLTEALALRDLAQCDNKGVMIGCMMGASMAMLPAYLCVNQAVKYVDIDGPLWLTFDNDLVLLYHQFHKVTLSNITQNYIKNNYV